MSTAYLSLGTNQGDLKENLQGALRLLEERAGRILEVSSFLETEPWGFRSSNRFLNAAVILETALEPLDLLSELQGIERKMGRTKKSHDGIYQDRSMDIDIIFYDDCIINHPKLTIPHPLAHKRAFVMDVMAEIAPDYVHPLLLKTVGELSGQLHENS